MLVVGHFLSFEYVSLTDDRDSGEVHVWFCYFVASLS